MRCRRCCHQSCRCCWSCCHCHPRCPRHRHRRYHVQSARPGPWLHICRQKSPAVTYDSQHAMCVFCNAPAGLNQHQHHYLCPGNLRPSQEVMLWHSVPGLSRCIKGRKATGSAEQLTRPKDLPAPMGSTSCCNILSGRPAVARSPARLRA